jgi:hypothetical protein
MPGKQDRSDRVNFSKEAQSRQVSSGWFAPRLPYR